MFVRKLLLNLVATFSKLTLENLLKSSKGISAFSKRFTDDFIKSVKKIFRIFVRKSLKKLIKRRSKKILFFC